MQCNKNIGIFYNGLRKKNVNYKILQLECGYQIKSRKEMKINLNIHNLPIIILLFNALRLSI